MYDRVCQTVSQCRNARLERGTVRGSGYAIRAGAEAFRFRVVGCQ